jgi:diguanylate cyclase (GGDEF)-like protein
VEKSSLLSLRWNLSPATRLAIGLVSLMVSLVLLADFFTGILTNRNIEAKRQRATMSQLVTGDIALMLERQNFDSLQSHLESVMHREPNLLLAAVRSGDGTLVATAGNPRYLQPFDLQAPSTLEYIRTPLLMDGAPWGDIEFAFKPVFPMTFKAWSEDPLIGGFVLIGTVGFVVFRLYLRRMLRYLDPNSAVPEHVRTAFDTLTEGVLVLDKDGKIMLANKAFRALHPDEVDRLSGVSADSLPWLCAGLSTVGPTLPWIAAIANKQAQLGHPFQIDVPFHGRRELIMNCSPITDEEGEIRGCLATFSDVTELQERTERLRIANDELAASQEQIRIKNEELTRLATRDALTGCFNRRALMTESELRIAEAKLHGTPLCCIMGDIDHFKKVNDTYGHGVGDLAIQAVAKAMERCLRNGDILGRYGGEEFCIMLPNTSLPQALEIAERLRMEVEATAGSSIREPSGIKITSSLGVSELVTSMTAPSALIDLADQALYRSKQTGRNRVTSWAEMASSVSKTEAAAAHA